MVEINSKDKVITPKVSVEITDNKFMITLHDGNRLESVSFPREHDHPLQSGFGIIEQLKKDGLNSGIAVDRLFLNAINSIKGGCLYLSLFHKRGYNMTWQQKVRQTLKKYEKEAFACLYPEDGDYAWGARKKNLDRTLKLMNNILKQVPKAAWGKDEDDDVHITEGNWQLSLRITHKRHSADLKFKNDDHTAWVIEHSKKKGHFVNFDIGGS